MKKHVTLPLIVLVLLSSCSAPPAAQSTPTTAAPTPAPTHTPTATALPTSTITPTLTPMPPSPTPDPPRPNAPDLSALGDGWATLSYTLKAGEDLGIVAARYGLNYDTIRIANGFTGGETFFPGQVILVPQRIAFTSPSYKIIPDSELVYGPSAVGFDAVRFLSNFNGGYLAAYTEVVDGVEVSGAALIQRAAENYSINPRLLITLLEYQSGWLTRSNPEEKVYPYGRAQGGTEGLFRQLQWVSNALNSGFYQWRAGSLGLLILADGTRVGLNTGLNAGTAAIQFVMSETRTAAGWEESLGERGVAAIYRNLFGGPFANAIEPLVPPSVTQPELTLPWQAGESWFYSGGPHPSFGSGSVWGAIDFLPPGKESGCGVSPYWVTAVADGVVARSSTGQLLLDLDGDGYEQTGWVVLYLHVAEQDRPKAGDILLRGDKVGHASCEGGAAVDAHLHLARKYNGVWLTADDPLAPFVMDEYTVRAGAGIYDGLLQYGQFFKEACACRNESNAVTK